MYDYYDIESGEIVTMVELKAEFDNLQTNEPWNVENMTFDEYLENCLTANGGTLEKID
jgi:hypothetical protein